MISEKYLADEAAKLRFLREARAAASVRHPNVASVFHLGRKGQDYFYAMEFVEGETLDAFIRRSGPLKMNLALAITMQVAAGLAAVHKQKLVHRDIKPSNIMVRLEDGGSVTAKIIDLGLAKAVNESGSQVPISTPGGFAGTPEFASPEQFAGVGVDIRSDLYSLGVVFWEMLTGHRLFEGSPAEVMYQHLHAPLPLRQLTGLPEPVVALAKVLLEKDPLRRFQSPTELLQQIPTIASAIEEGRTVTYQNLQQMPAADFYAVTRKALGTGGPEKVSVCRLPVTGIEIVGREHDIAFLDDSWANEGVNIAAIVAWAGVGKSTLVNHWLRRLAVRNYGSAELVFAWSFYRQGSSGGTSSADEFLETSLAWFGDPNPRTGTAWEKGERLAHLIAHRRTLLVLDGLEPLQYPPGPQEGRLREACLQALLRDLAAFNKGLCVITTRLPVVDLAEYERTSTRRRTLEHLSSEAGATLLGALGVRGSKAELQEASNEFGGHCLALTLLGSYLTDVYDGDVHRRKEVSERLTLDVRQGAHARKVMESYQTWFGEGPELSVLRILGLFDRPVDEKALEALLKPPAICGLTESLTDLSPSEWRTIVAKLRRARLVAREDPQDPAQLDTHPLVHEYFCEQLRSQRPEAWKEANRRLFEYYQASAPGLPDNIGEMEPLLLGVICGCHAGLFREALHDIYISRIQRGRASFASNVLGARGALLSALVHFFVKERWKSPLNVGIGEHSLNVEDQLFVLMQAALNLTATRGMVAPEARSCYENAESLCHSVNRPLLLYQTLMGQWHYSFMTDRLSATLHIAERIYLLSREVNDAALLIGSHGILASTYCFLGDFEAARQHASRGVELWRSGATQSSVEHLTAPIIICLCFESISKWHFGELASCHATMEEAISLAKEMNDTHTLATALVHAAMLYQLERLPAKVEKVTSTLIELSTRERFAQWLTLGKLFRGWARSVLGDMAGGLLSIEDAIREYRGSGGILCVPYLLAMKAEALDLADRTSEALDAIREAEVLVERSEDRWWSAEMERLRGVFLARLGADEAEIEDAFCKAVSIASQQRSTSLARRAQASLAEYRGEIWRM